MSDLLPAENMALTVAKAQAARGDLPNIATVLILTVERLDAAIQAVRNVCLDPAHIMRTTALPWRDTEWVDLTAVLNALDGTDDDNQSDLWDGTPPFGRRRHGRESDGTDE